MSSAAHDVVGIGSAIVDVIAHADEAFLARRSLTKGIMRLIDGLEADRLYSEMGPGVEMSGGSVANTMAGIASLGGRAGYIGLLRDDQLGTMNTYLGACVELGPEHLDRALIESAQVLYLEGYLFDPPRAKAAIRAAAEIAHGAGRKVSLSLSDPFCVERHRADFRALIADHVDIVFANEIEIGSLYETGDFEAAARAAAHDCEIAVLTRSAKGSVVVAGAARHEIPAAPVPQVVDTTGAGDLYASGFLYGITYGRPLDVCGRLGSLCAAEIISHIGARPERPLKDLAAASGLL